MCKIALQTYTIKDFIKNEADLRASLKKVADIGYTNLQFTKPAYMTIEEQAALAKEFGMTIDSVYHPICDMEKDFDGVCRNAEIIGTNVVRTSEIGGELKNSAEGYCEFSDILNHWGKALKERGLLLVTHFHAYQFINFGQKGRGIDIIIDNTDPNSVFFMPDLFWLTAAGVEASHYLKRFKGRAFYMHVNDYAIKQLEGVLGKVPALDAPIGQGNINWPAVMASAKEVGIEEFVVELEDSGDRVFEDLTISYTNLKYFIKKYFC